ncbi:MAG: RagB/SusD family nutrient uptake outer membrane protein, partial [Planctomycetota bacterium]
MYNHLNRVNNIIAALETLETDQEARRNSLRGEALALRAIAHFDLLRLYAQPYLFTEDGSHPGVVLAERPFEVTERPARRTVAEGYTLIESDLLRAVELLGPSARRTTDRISLT